MLVAFKQLDADPWKVGNRLIAVWTRSEVVHCELVLETMGEPLSVSAEPGRPGLLIRPLAESVVRPDKWTAYRVPGAVDEADVLAYCLTWQGSPYNMAGLLLSGVFGRSVEVPGHWFCSELCYTVLVAFAPWLDLPYIPPHTVTPSRLAHWLETHCEALTLTDFVNV